MKYTFGCHDAVLKQVSQIKPGKESLAYSSSQNSKSRNTVEHEGTSAFLKTISHAWYRGQLYYQCEMKCNQGCKNWIKDHLKTTHLLRLHSHKHKCRFEKRVLQTCEYNLVLKLYAGHTFWHSLTMQKPGYGQTSILSASKWEREQLLKTIQ